MSLGVLTNIAAIYAQNNLNQTQGNLQKTLQELSSGSRINSGADDAAGLAVADGLRANQAALSQSAQNAQSGVGLLQTADGALAQVTNLLTRATTLATEATNSTFNTAQLTAANTEFQSIVTEINNIGSTTNFNGNAVFSATAASIVTTDGTTSGTATFAPVVGVLTSTSIGGTAVTLGADVLTSNASAKTALADITASIAATAAQRGTIGASINQLSAASSVASTEQVNLASAESSIRATNYGQAASDLAKYQVLSQTGISALAQANSVQNEVLKLLQ